MGTTTPEKVKQLLMEDVVLSDAMATQGVERYTFRAPGQAISYSMGIHNCWGCGRKSRSCRGRKFNARKVHRPGRVLALHALHWPAGGRSGTVATQIG
jgi:uncharacterized protein (DUF885 family)